MATIKPFAAVRPDPKTAAQVCELPYDVMSTEEARALAGDNAYSFLRVSKPEIALPPGTDPYSSDVYEIGKRTFQTLVSSGVQRLDVTHPIILLVGTGEFVLPNLAVQILLATRYRHQPRLGVVPHDLPI